MENSEIIHLMEAVLLAAVPAATAKHGSIPSDLSVRKDDFRMENSEIIHLTEAVLLAAVPAATAKHGSIPSDLSVRKEYMRNTCGMSAP